MDLLCVSGGIDSMYLAWKWLGDGRLFGIAHCNFCLRGEDSDADEEFVRGWAREHGIRIHVARFDTRSWASEHGVSIEMAARELRYRFFAETAMAEGYDAVVVAHHADDNAETLILNLLRGTGLRGICGMKAVSTLPVEGCTVPLLRPLLGITREEIETAMEGRAWREDRTNAENDVKRNKIRNLVFPVFKEINPSFVKTLGRDMERFAEAARLLPEDFFEDAGHPEDTGTGDISAEGPLKIRYCVTEESWDGTLPLKQAPGVLILDADRVKGELEEVAWEPGAWIRPFGMGGRKKIQDWFTDHHISVAEKYATPLLRDTLSPDPLHIGVIVGRTIDDGLRVTPATRRILRITLL